MVWQWTPYAILPLAAALTLFITGFNVLRRRINPASASGALVLFACAELMLAFFLETLSIEYSAKILWTKMQYGGLIVAPTAWVVYSLQYTGREKLLTKRNVILMSIVPLTILSLVFTNEMHGYVWGDIQLDTSGPFPELDKTFGIGYWVMVTYLYILLLISGFLHVEMFIRSRRLYRWQASVLIIATIFPFLGSAFDAFNISPLPRLVSTSVGIMLGGLIAAFTIYRVRYGDIKAVSHSAVFERMGDAVIVLDARGYIVDLNASAQNLIAHSSSESIGQRVTQIWPDRLELPQGDAELSKEVVLGPENMQLSYDMRISPMTDWRGHLVSWVMVLRDITKRTRSEGMLVQKAQELSRSNAFITALSRVSAHIKTTQDPEQVMETLGTELQDMGITSIVSMLVPSEDALVIRYSSITADILPLGERIFGHRMRNFHIRRDHFQIWEDLIEQGQVTIIEDEIGLVASMLPGILRPLIESVFRMGGWKPGGITVWLPLIIESQVIGAIMLWGQELKESDVPVLSVFAGQVATALESARLYAAEQERSEQLSRAGELLQQELAERKQAEQALQVSLRDKEILLKEIHHRTKNNLQIISSMINLQSKLLKDQRVLSIFDDSQSRIRSMALIHEMLYQSESLAEVKYSEYIHGLVSHFRDTYYTDSQKVRFQIEVEDISLSIDHAIPCGLILNELVSNALKHAFPADQEGVVQIEFFRDRQDYTLRVHDDGVGLSDEVDFPNSNTLGLQLVSALVQQLDGSISLDRSQGTAFAITFDDAG